MFQRKTLKQKCCGKNVNNSQFEHKNYAAMHVNKSWHFNTIMLCMNFNTDASDNKFAMTGQYDIERSNGKPMFVLIYFILPVITLA